MPSSRRAVLGAVLSAGAVGAMPAAVPIACTSPALTLTDQRALDLWKRLRKLLAIRQRLEDDYDAATARMPAWARSGPKYGHPDGSPADDYEVGWPMVADLSQAPVSPVTGKIIARPRVEDLYDQWRHAGARDEATRELTRALVAHAQRLELRPNSASKPQARRCRPSRPSSRRLVSRVRFSRSRRR
jgi:hypothetical protein